MATRYCGNCDKSIPEGGECQGCGVSYDNSETNATARERVKKFFQREAKSIAAHSTRKKQAKKPLRIATPEEVQAIKAERGRRASMTFDDRIEEWMQRGGAGRK